MTGTDNVTVNNAGGSTTLDGEKVSGGICGRDDGEPGHHLGAEHRELFQQSGKWRVTIYDLGLMG